MSTPGIYEKDLLLRAEQLKSKLDGNKPGCILLTEGEDPRMLEAATIISQSGFARVKILFQESEPPDNLARSVEAIVVADEGELRREFADKLLELRGSKGMNLTQAQSLVTQSLYFGALYLSGGFVDAAVSGARNTTTDVIRAGLYGVGLKPEVQTVSSIFLMILQDGKVLTYADCGVVPYPSVEQLADISISSADSHTLLTKQQAHVAMLSFSTLGSASHQSVENVKRALELVRGRRPELNIDGELQFDAAFVPEVAKRKAMQSPVAGRANVMIFPNLDAGNIAYKITERIGGARALGPILQGLNQPWMDLSRGCSAQDIALVSAVGLILSDS